MTRYSHLWLGFIVGERFLDINLLHPNPDIIGRYHLLALLAMLIGSYAPDLDMYFTNFKKQPFNQRTLLFSHRGWTHHILLPFVIYFIALYLHSLFLGFIALGVGFHIAFDLFSPLGVPWGWRYKQRLRFSLYYTGKSSEILFVLAVTLLIFIVPRSAFAGNVSSNVRNLHELEAQYENQAKNYKSVVNNSIIYSKSGTAVKAKKEAGKSYEYFQKSVMPMVNQYYKPSTKSKVCLKSNQILPKNSYVFIFMSSSVPYTTWHNYAVAIDNLRKQGQGNIGLIIRGCIGGCKKVMPTMNFIQKIIQNKKLKVPILIDPLLFRLYDIKKVPTFVYAKNVKVLNPTISLGSSKNLKSHITAYKLIGDCGMPYAFKKLYDKSGDNVLIELDDVLSKGWLEK